MDSPIKVLVVDDSALMRNLISRMLRSEEGIEVPAVAMNGQFGINKISKYDVDVITLDLEMPVMDGLGFLREKKRLGIDIPVIVFSSIAQKGAEITMKALALGASDFILKPTGSGGELKEIRSRLVDLVKIYAAKYRFSKGLNLKNEQQKRPAITKIEKEVPLVETIESAPVKKENRSRKRKTSRIEIIAIGISTGGPNALRQILPHINKNLSAPIVIVQHMPAGFTKEFARSLDKICPIEVKEAENGDIIAPGKIFVAPGGQHLKVVRQMSLPTLKLTKTEAVNGHRPSVDVLFESIAGIYHAQCLAIIMTGMGKDGVQEIGTIYNEGGITVAQDPSSCIVPGMPGTAIRAGNIDEIVHLDKIAHFINDMAKRYE